MPQTTEYIVIGGGAAGCALTSKLLSQNKEVFI